MFAKSILVCLLVLTCIQTTIGSRSLKLLGDTSTDINEIIQDILDGGSSSLGSRSPFPDILRISTGDDDDDDDNGDGNPFQSFFERIQSLADEPDSVLGSIFQRSGINIRDILSGAGY
eukprot:TRINITY_DN339_c0_g2_i1.p2 TRINITY_DN339_c0_g2~~TRINITY_DN339_c0_g2_i1.p2  ORF type:complete len:118 (-),score=15.07 TRINITY_DN339_c0_g2_i1:418-771(-)